MITSKVKRDDWMWGFSCEFLRVEDIIDLKVAKLMKDHEFGLFLKMYEEDFDETFARFLTTLNELDIYDHFYPWPCLGIDEGYYPNEHTVDKFIDLIHRIMKWYNANNFNPPEYILVDLEPDINPEKFKEAERLRNENRLIFRNEEGEIQLPDLSSPAFNEQPLRDGKKKEKKGFDAMSFAGKLIDDIDDMDEQEFMKNSKKFQELVDTMHGYGTKALCVALPLAFDDLADGRHLLQDFLTTPIQTVDWDMVNYMIFASPTKSLFDHDDYVHLIHSYCMDFKERHGEKASITFGITGFGRKLAQVDPRLYIKEFNAALSAGVTKLGIFCLENILMLGETKYKAFFDTVNAADGDFTPDPEKLEFARMQRRLWEGIDYIAPVLKYLVDSGRAMKLIQSLTKGLF